jgi:hypothetical protein
MSYTNLPQSPLQEQPLLLEDLLEQEKREQEKQQQHQPLLSQQPQPPPDSASSPLLSDVDFERLRADVLGTPAPTAGSPRLGSPPQGIPGRPVILFSSASFHFVSLFCKEMFLLYVSVFFFCSLDHAFSNYDERKTNEMPFQTKPYI